MRNQDGIHVDDAREREYPESEQQLPSAQAAVEDHGASQLVGSGDVVGPLARRHWKAPFRYDAEGAMIWDARGERALDVRGWGMLTGQGALGLPETLAEKALADFGESVVRILNASWPNVPHEPHGK